MVRPPIKFKLISGNAIKDYNAVLFGQYGSPGTVNIDKTNGIITYSYSIANSGHLAYEYRISRIIPRIIVEFSLSVGNSGFAGVGIKLSANPLWIVIDAYQNVRKVEYAGISIRSVSGVTVNQRYYERLIITGPYLVWMESTDGNTWNVVWFEKFTPVDLRIIGVITGLAFIVGNYIGGSGTNTIYGIELSIFGGFGYRDLRRVANPDGTWYRDRNGYYYMLVTLAGAYIPGACLGIVRSRNPQDPNTWELINIVLFSDGTRYYGHHAGWAIVNPDNTVDLYVSSWGDFDITNTVVMVYSTTDITILVNSVPLILMFTKFGFTSYDPTVIYYNGIWYIAYSWPVPANTTSLYRCTAKPNPDNFNTVCSKISDISYGSVTEGAVFNIHNGKPKLYLVYTGGMWYRHGLNGSYEASLLVPNTIYITAHPTGLLYNYLIVHSNELYGGINDSHGDATVITVPSTFYYSSCLPISTSYSAGWQYIASCTKPVNCRGCMCLSPCPSLRVSGR